MSIVFHIENLDTEIFVSQFSLLTSTKKEIFRKMQFLSQKFPALYISQERIAKMVGCCRKTVNEALKEFFDLGWILKIYRHYRTCVYIIKENLKWFNPIKWLTEQWELKSKKVNEIWSRVTLRVTQVLNMGIKRACEQAQFKDSDLPLHLQSLTCSFEEKRKLACFPSDVYHQALKSCKMKKDPILDAFQYLFATCRKICKERNIKPNWKWIYG